MKKVFVLFTFVMLIITLAGCKPALEDDLYKLNLDYNVYNADDSVKIDVYVNDTLMDVKVFADDYEIVGPYNLSNYTLAQPIMDFLGIKYKISEKQDSVKLTSEKYGEMEFTYVGSSYREDVTMIGGKITIIDEKLYLPFWVFRVYTDGSLKQDDSSSMYLYTGDYERTDLPETLEECYEMLDRELSPEDIMHMKNATENDLAMAHMGLGLWIRNNWLYTEQSKLTKLLLENGIDHIDNMSSLIMRGYVRYLNGQPCSLDDLLNDSNA